ncbi:MAG: hypothetical protein A2904_01280 [Candidatus Staskawiczbacteria bacterium RIFCSPLOWO2_01_FULL_33_9]|uniref:Uncharacterized protein n=1 Tax=Candidatus Staskawiczbacteria bacterium RIFCSPLOWO2_01_FULL_33_9 TaxID=1802211 RepID=A0A1G2I638_9BACT|nr:MAG: hypothetical protein A2904_01280 [Candidatus Staskawiczbacteria bacterium RIFCSPLOWO2_01_FULL_33_9]
MNKFIIAVVIVVFVVLGGYFLWMNIYQPTSLVYQPSNEQTDSQLPILVQPEDKINPQPSIEKVPTYVNGNIITYTDAGYSPNTIGILTGRIVTFKNQSSKPMWPASAMHPSHRLYDGTSLDEHCPDTDNSAFDACTGILPGESWSFKFDKTGNWKYHDHLNPSNYGTIVVTLPTKSLPW